MTAIEFIQNHGFNAAWEILNKYPSITHVTNDARHFLNENDNLPPHIIVQLPYLVSCKELRSNEAKKILEEVKARNHKYAQNFERPALEKAIADVESVGGGV